MSLFLLQAVPKDGYFGNMARWQEIKELYTAQKYSEALQSLQSNPEDTAIYYYNLGTLYARLNRLAYSVAYLEKANRLKPGDHDIQQNLAWTKARLTPRPSHNTLSTTSLDFWDTEQVAEFVQYPSIHIALSFLLLIFVFFWLKTYSAQRNLKQTLKTALGFASLSGIFIIIGLFGLATWTTSQPIAVCLEHQVIRSGPGEHFMELFQIEAGTKVQLMGQAVLSVNETLQSPLPTATPTFTPAQPQNQLEQWRQIRYSNEGIGWIKSSDLIVL